MVNKQKPLAHAAISEDADHALQLLGEKRTPGSLQSRFAGIQQAGKHRAAVASSFWCVQEARHGLSLASPLLYESQAAMTHNDVYSASSRPFL